MNNTANLSSHTKLLPWLIWGLGALYYGYEFFLQVSPSVMVPDLMHSFKVDAATLGNLAAIYFYAYAAMQIPAGMFLDRLGPRRLLTIASAICVIGALIFGLAPSLGFAQIGRFLIGIGSAFAVLGSFKLAANWFPFERFTFIAGLTITLGMTGAVVGGAPMAFLVESVGWRLSMVILAIIGAGLSALIWINVRDLPVTVTTKNLPQKKSQEKILTSLLYIIKKPQSWITAIYGGLMFAPTSAFAALWGVPFFITKYHLSRTDAAAAISMIFIGWAVGCPLVGWISDYIRRRKPTMYIGSAGGLICMLVVIYVSIPPSLLYITMFLFGFFCSGFLPAFSILREINSPRTTATALGYMNMMNMIGGAVLQPLIGWILDRYWDAGMDKIHNNARVFSIHAYYVALASLPIILAIALFMIPLIKETKCQQVME